MNLLHRWYCRSPGWKRIVQEGMLPWILKDVDLGDNVLEIGPGPGVTTDWLRERVPHMTAVEIDHSLATKLAQRLADTNVKVVEGDATRMTFPDSSFSSALSFTMLHHVPSAELQDRLLAEACRVLRPGGLFIGADSTTSVRFRLYHIADTNVPVDPHALEPRLQAAGFANISVNVRQEGGFNFRARKPSRQSA